MIRTNFTIIYSILLLTIFVISSCDSDITEVIELENTFLQSQNNISKSGIPKFLGKYTQTDRLARPIISIILVPQGNDSEQFNRIIPSKLNSIFQPIIQNRLTDLSPAFSNPNDKNVLGKTAPEFADFLATDILNVSTKKSTEFSLTRLTGRKLNDDIITTVLQWIFAGEDLTENPGLSDDNVDTNDVPFLSHFPYMAPPFLE